MPPARLIHVATSARFWPFLSGQPAYLRDRGFEVYAASAAGPQLDALAREEPVSAWTVPLARAAAPWKDLLALLRLYRLFRRLRPVIVHCHTPKAGLLGMLGAWLARVPARFYTLHGLVWESRRGWRRRLLLAAERMACRCAVQVLAVSFSVREAAIAARLAPSWKITVPACGSANGLDFDQFQRSRVTPEELHALRRRYRLPEGAPVLGFAGRLVPDKGLDALEAAWRRLRSQFPALHLLFAGESEPHDPLPPALLESLRRDPRVRFTGWVADLPAHYALMDVAALPSRREGLPYAALEAAAMETPVAGFAVTGVTDAVQHGVTGLLAAPGDPAGLAAAIARLLDTPPLARRLGRRARRRALRLYRREPLYAALHSRYLEALEAPRPVQGKRWLDALSAAAALVGLAPLLLFIALAVWLDLGSPVLFRQRRLGLSQRPFDVLKFRTMRNPHRSPGLLAGDQRLTRLGRFLRRASLDELPQLVNILRGEMSFIGPRPLLERYGPWFTARERRRHRVRPGLSGWAQIHGRNDLPWNERLEMDAWYADHVSWRLDIRIALTTLGKILRMAGVQDDPRGAMLDLDEERRQA